MKQINAITHKKCSREIFSSENIPICNICLCVLYRSPVIYLDKYPTTHHFVTEMCTRVHISVANGALWNIRLMHYGICAAEVLLCHLNIRLDFELKNTLHLALRSLYWYDDVSKWKYFPRYWPFVRGIHRSPVNSPHNGQWRGALMFSLACAWINGWVNNGEAGDLRRHHAQYDVTVMGCQLWVVWRNSTVL